MDELASYFSAKLANPELATRVVSGIPPLRRSGKPDSHRKSEGGGGIPGTPLVGVLGLR